MAGMRCFCFGLFVLVLAAGGLSAEPLTLDAAVDRALGVNLDYQNALLSVDRARNALSSWINWKDIAVSVTQKQTSGSGSAGTPGAQPATATTTLGLNLPIFDQLGASATVDQTGSSQFSVNYSPLLHSDASTQARIAYDQAALLADQAKSNLQSSVRKAFLNQLVGEAKFQVQVETTKLKETAYQDAKARYAQATVTLAEVRTALQDWVSAKSSQSLVESNLVKARAELARQLQSETLELVPLTAEDLEAAIASLGPIDLEVVGSSSSLEVQRLEAQSQRAKADAVWWLDPGLTVSGNASYTSEGKLTWSGTATLKLALGDWKGSDKLIAERAAELAAQNLSAQAVQVRSTEAQAILALSSGRDNVATRQMNLEQSKELETETGILFRAGQVTLLESEQAVLAVRSAQIELLGAWTDLYIAHLDLRASRR